MSALFRLHRALTVVLVVLVLAQAALAGRSLFGTLSITIHGVLGNVTFAAGVACLLAAVVSRAGRSAVVVAALLTVGLTAQVGLGYVGRSRPEAAAWHIPLGVLLFGLAVYQADARGRRSEP